jgi:hypothetical protein
LFFTAPLGAPHLNLKFPGLPFFPHQHQPIAKGKMGFNIENTGEFVYNNALLKFIKKKEKLIQRRRVDFLFQGGSRHLFQRTEHQYEE